MAITLFSCKKKTETVTPEPTPPPIKTVAQFTVENYSGFPQATAKFQYTGSNDNAGTVFLNNFQLAKQTAFYYYLATGPTTIASPVTWKVQGDGSTIPAYTLTVNDLPSIPAGANLDTSKIIDASMDFVITHQAISCDSLCYQIAFIPMKKTIGSNTSVTFTSAELQNAAYVLYPGGDKKVNVTVFAYSTQNVMVGDKRWRMVTKATFYKPLHYKP